MPSPFQIVATELGEIILECRAIGKEPDEDSLADLAWHVERLAAVVAMLHGMPTPKE